MAPKASLVLFIFFAVQALLLGPSLVNGQFDTDQPLAVNTTTERIFLYRFFRYFTNVSDELSEECRSVTRYFWHHRSDDWASKVIDSNSVQESGLASGNIQFLGQFDECLSLRVPETATKSLTTSDLQYCTISFPISMLLSPNESRQFPAIVVQIAPPLAGICYPAACRAETDLRVILEKYSNMTNQTVKIDHCITEDDLLLKNRFKIYHVVILITFTLLILICIIATFFDLFYHQPPTKPDVFTKLYRSFSLARNFAFLFQNTSSTSRSSPTAILNRPEHASTAKLNELAASNDSLSSTESDSEHSGHVSEFSSTSSSSSSSASSSSTISAREPLPPPRMLKLGRAVGLASSETEPEVKPEVPLMARPQIECLHGIRFISFLFILIYHTFTEAQTPSANILRVLDAERNFEKQLITNATLWVDTFLLLSGFLVAHSLLYQKPKKPAASSSSSSLWSHLFEHPKRLLHRYLRLTPSIAGVLALSILIEPLGSGPVWHQYTDLSVNTCHQNWWILFLYVNNIFKLNQPSPVPSECLSYLWYLAVDMQFFLVSPLLIMCLTSSKKRIQQLGILINLAVIAASWTITAILMAANGLTPTVLVTVYDLPYINLIYKAAYCRIGPYCLGILLAYFLYQQSLQSHLASKTSLKPKSSRPYLQGALNLLLATVLILAITLLTYPWLQGASYHNAPAVLYGTVHRTIWALGWALIICACVQGQLPLLNRTLGAGVFQFLSKLTYQCYLLHSILISAVTSSVRQKMYYSDSNFVFDIFRYLILTVMVSMCTFVLFERPFINLEQAFLK